MKIEYSQEGLYTDFLVNLSLFLTRDFCKYASYYFGLGEIFSQYYLRLNTFQSYTVIIKNFLAKCSDFNHQVILLKNFRPTRTSYQIINLSWL